MRLPGPLLLTAISSVMFLSSTARADPCTARQLRARTTETISLDGLKGGVREHAAFYLRDTRKDLVFFFKPEHVLALLESWSVHAVASDRSTFAESLERVRSDLPLKEDTDLFKYGIHSNIFNARLDDLVVELLDAGHAMIDFYPLHDSGRYAGSDHDQYDPVKLKRVHWANRGGNGRQYCNDEGRDILFIVDTIHD